MLTLYANFKGGTGKSTIVFNMAIWRMEQGKKVTVCDLDPQRTVTDVAMIRDEDEIDPRLKVVHSLPEKGKARGDWLVDVGTSDMAAVRAAIRACGQIVIPVTPSQADIWATQRFLEIVKEERGKSLPVIKAFLNRADPHPRSYENAESLEALQSLGMIKQVMQAKLVQRMAFRRSFSEGLAAFELEPGSKAAAELDALAREIYGSK